MFNLQKSYYENWQIFENFKTQYEAIQKEIANYNK